MHCIFFFFFISFPSPPCLAHFIFFLKRRVSRFRKLAQHNTTELLWSVYKEGGVEDEEGYKQSSGRADTHLGTIARIRR
ncbi:hypothetical protein K457DRAFT_134536 [Linnemannia elongata AG-77]|uniref:Secreted protein n=1 Tax=Linnemannia elongata AG-77 TaxID=1314771 RepID=A0A197K7F0_9FUNG|nr:hypothetical protein K457DRAFT_134536 [Linnemannia elongata AG-77]